MDPHPCPRLCWVRQGAVLGSGGVRREEDLRPRAFVCVSLKTVSMRLSVHLP